MNIALPQIAGHDILTHSRLACFKTCARKHWLRYDQGVRPVKDSRALRFGAAVHEIIDRVNRGEPIETAIHVVVDEMVPLDPSIDLYDEHIMDACKVGALMEGYYAYWGNSEDGSTRVIDTLVSEQAFELPIRNLDTGRSSRTYAYAGKIDAIVRLADGRLAVMETKTTSSPCEYGSDYWMRLRVDDQITGYLLGARSLGYEVDTIIYNVILKPRQERKQVADLDPQGLKMVVNENGERVRNKKNEWKQTAGDFERMLRRPQTVGEMAAEMRYVVYEELRRWFHRYEVVRTPQQIDEWQQQLWQQAAAVRDGHDYRNTSACLSFGRCEYLAVCHTSISRAGYPPEFTAIEHAHPELETNE